MISLLVGVNGDELLHGRDLTAKINSHLELWICDSHWVNTAAVGFL